MQLINAHTIIPSSPPYLPCLDAFSCLLPLSVNIPWAIILPAWCRCLRCTIGPRRWRTIITLLPTWSRSIHRSWRRSTPTAAPVRSWRWSRTRSWSIIRSWCGSGICTWSWSIQCTRSWSRDSGARRRCIVGRGPVMCRGMIGRNIVGVGRLVSRRFGSPCIAPSICRRFRTRSKSIGVAWCWSLSTGGPCWCAVAGTIRSSTTIIRIDCS